MKPTGAMKEWRVEPRPIHGYQVVDSDGTEILADVYRKEDAELIVTAVNERKHYTQLLQAAKFLLAMNATNYDRDTMRSEGGFEVLQKAVDLIEGRTNKP